MTELAQSANDNNELLRSFLEQICEVICFRVSPKRKAEVLRVFEEAEKWPIHNYERNKIIVRKLMNFLEQDFQEFNTHREKTISRLLGSLIIPFERKKALGLRLNDLRDVRAILQEIEALIINNTDIGRTMSNIIETRLTNPNISKEYVASLTRANEGLRRDVNWITDTSLNPIG